MNKEPGDDHAAAKGLTRLQWIVIIVLTIALVTFGREVLWKTEPVGCGNTNLDVCVDSSL